MSERGQFPGFRDSFRAPGIAGLPQWRTLARDTGLCHDLPQGRPTASVPADMDELCANQREKYKRHNGKGGPRHELALHGKRTNVTRTGLINLRLCRPPALCASVCRGRREDDGGREAASEKGLFSHEVECL